MIYRDYSRAEGEWIPNQYGGRENLEAIEFLKHTNWKIHSEVSGAISIAEESTSFGGVTHPTENGGLGFNFKWNMGWMNDTLSYMKLDPVYRRYHHDKMTFGMIYQYSENFVLPLSHDEVVHGKCSLLGKMPGDAWQKFANLRAYYGYMWGYPGKKLLFMGNEFAQGREWNYEEIVANGDNIKVTVNGVVIMEGNIREATKNGTADHKEHPGLFNKKGHIGFLGHGSPVKFRNIRIKELK